MEPEINNLVCAKKHGRGGVGKCLTVLSCMWYPIIGHLEMKRAK